MLVETNGIALNDESAAGRKIMFNTDGFDTILSNRSVTANSPEEINFADLTFSGAKELDAIDHVAEIIFRRTPTQSNWLTLNDQSSQLGGAVPLVEVSVNGNSQTDIATFTNLAFQEEWSGKDIYSKWAQSHPRSYLTFQGHVTSLSDSMTAPQGIITNDVVLVTIAYQPGRAQQDSSSSASGEIYDFPKSNGFTDTGYATIIVEIGELTWISQQMSVVLPPESGPPTGIDCPTNWRISDGWKKREARGDCIETSAG